MPRGSKLLVEIGIGAEPTHARVNIADVVGVPSWRDAKFTAVGIDRDAVSRARGSAV